MFILDKFFIIMDGAKAMALSDDNQISWTDDIKKAFLFTDLQEAEDYRRKNFKEEFHRVPLVKPLIIQYIVH